ncbi:MAG: ATP-binding protein [Crocinitomicaceae bacterium]|nr:ATP-binding protein [Crocinitomicaceae bacterium]
MSGDLAILLIGTAGMLLMLIAFMTFAYRNQKQLMKKEVKVREINELLKSEELKSAYALLEGQDNERQRISNDLHDRMGGQLATIKIYLDLLNETQLSDDQQKLLNNILESTSSSIDEVRAIAHDLNSSTLKYYGLQKAIEHLSEAINASKKTHVTYHFSINHDLESRFMRDVYHIIQELMTNSLKHAGATKIHIELTSLKDELNLIFEDNGIGFTHSDQHEGIGLKSIGLRVERYQGTLTIDSTPTRGSSFIVEIPISHE